MTIRTVLTITDIVLIVESVVTVWLLIYMIGNLNRVSRLPLFITMGVTILIGGYSLLSLLGITTLYDYTVSILTVRSLIILLMGMPSWILLATYRTNCGSCQVRKRIREKYGE
jgi:hypothetical protein